jgi:RNA polymerase sigma factor (sigma-70 family)
MPASPASSTAVNVLSGKHEQLSEQACRRMIASYREQMEWLIRLPELESCLSDGLVQLNLPQPRRGINLRSVLDTLLLENKYLVTIWALQNFERPITAQVALKTAELFGFDRIPSRQLDKTLTVRQNEQFLHQLIRRIKSQHLRYKRCQTVLFRRYQSLLHKMVNRQVFNPDKRPDAYQEASIGLLHAIDKVSDSSASFGSYAQTWISRHIRNFLMEDHFPVHVPINLASRILRHRTAPGDSSQNSTAEVLSENLQNLAKPGISIDDQGDEENEGKVRQFEDPACEAPSETAVQNDMHQLLRVCINELTPKQREVLNLRYGLGQNGSAKTLSCIAADVGISHQQVSMREKRALQKLEAVMRPMLKELAH